MIRFVANLFCFHFLEFALAQGVLYELHTEQGALFRFLETGKSSIDKSKPLLYELLFFEFIFKAFE